MKAYEVIMDSLSKRELLDEEFQAVCREVHGVDDTGRQASKAELLAEAKRLSAEAKRLRQKARVL